MRVGAHRRRPTRHRRGRRSRRAPGSGQREPVHRGRLHRRTLHDVRRPRARGVRPTGAGTITLVATADGVNRCASHRRPLIAVPAMTWELRWHPFRAEWVLFTSHRARARGSARSSPTTSVSAPADNALAPLGRRIDTTNPDYRGVFMFTNDLPVFSPDAPSRRPVKTCTAHDPRCGTAEVVCYHHDPTRSMADLDDDEVTPWCHVARTNRRAAGARRRRARARLREPRCRRRHLEPAPALPDLRRRAGVRHHGPRGGRRGRAPRRTGGSLLADVVNASWTALG